MLSQKEGDIVSALWVIFRIEAKYLTTVWKYAAYIRTLQAVGSWNFYVNLLAGMDMRHDILNNIRERINFKSWKSMLVSNINNSLLLWLLKQKCSVTHCQQINWPEKCEHCEINYNECRGNKTDSNHWVFVIPPSNRLRKGL